MLTCVLLTRTLWWKSDRMELIGKGAGERERCVCCLTHIKISARVSYRTATLKTPQPNKWLLSSTNKSLLLSYVKNISTCPFFFLFLAVGRSRSSCLLGLSWWGLCEALPWVRQRGAVQLQLRLPVPPALPVPGAPCTAPAATASSCASRESGLADKRWAVGKAALAALWLKRTGIIALGVCLKHSERHFSAEVLLWPAEVLTGPLTSAQLRVSTLALSWI